MRHFEFSAGTSNKFWEVWVEGTNVFTRYGKIGTTGQVTVKDLGDAGGAQKLHDSLVREKTGKGYVEQGATAVAAAPTTRAATTSRSSPDDLVFTELRERIGGNATIYSLRLNGRLAVGANRQVIVTTDAKTFRVRRAPPREVLSLTLLDDAWYATGVEGLFAVSRDRGDSWRTIKVPTTGYLFAFFRDASGTCWLGGDHGVVLTSQSPERGWKAAPLGLKDKVLDIRQVGSRLYFVGSAGGVAREGTRTTRFEGIDKHAVLTRLTATPSGALVAIGDRGAIYRSTDGLAWKPVKAETKGDDLEDLAWVAGSLFVVGGKGLVLESRNEGVSFRALDRPTSQRFWSIASWGDGALVAGERGVVFRLAAPKDGFWRGAVDEFAPPPPKTPEGFVVPAPVAGSEHEKLVQALTAEAERGWASLAAKKRRAPVDEFAQLATAIDENPADEGAWSVLADSLHTKGDPRGELASVQRQRQANPKDAALKKAEAELLKANREPFLGPLAGAKGLTLEWTDGYITSARLANERDDDDDDDDGEALSVPAMLGKLLDHPSGRFLRSLTVGLVTHEENDYGQIIAELAKRTLPSLRSVFLGDFDSDETEISWSAIGNASPLYGSAPRLEALKLRSGSMTLGSLTHPRLKTLTIETGGLTRKNLKEFAGSALPSLESLSLQFGQDNYGCDIEAADLAGLLDAKRFPNLKHLGLTNAEFMNGAVALVAKSRLLPQLESLDLSLGTLGDEGAHALATYRPAFAHLKRLDLTKNYLSKEGVKLVSGLCAEVLSGKQRDDRGNPDDRYASVGE
jgi:predicted DNA-binding WGR domain protein/photosystem II stability/assembly factor-like uncharacterized protein